MKLNRKSAMGQCRVCREWLLLVTVVRAGLERFVGLGEPYQQPTLFILVAM